MQTRRGAATTTVSTPPKVPVKKSRFRATLAISQSQSPSQVSDERDQDLVRDEINEWERIGFDDEQLDAFRFSDGRLNELSMMGHFATKFPLHKIVFEQCGSDAGHEGNSETVFSTARLLSNTHTAPEKVIAFTCITTNHKHHEPSKEEVWRRYQSKYRKAGEKFSTNGRPSR